MPPENQDKNYKENMNFVFKNTIIAFFVFCFLPFIAVPAIASEMFFESDAIEFYEDQQFRVDLLLDAGGREINAIESRVIFPEIVNLVDVSDGSSVVTLWLNKTKESDSFSFSGIIPGGFSGVLTPYQRQPQPGKIISFILDAKEAGEGSIILENSQALLHDGKGTPDELSKSEFNFKILEKTDGAEEKEAVEQKKDNQPPEPFSLQIVKDVNLFSGRWVLIFSTQDKDSGMDHYEVREGDGPFIAVESPYLLHNQKLTKEIVVKAIDKAGNETEASIPARFAPKWYENYLNWVIIISATFIIFVILLIIFLSARRKNAGGK